jgi:hypothetical protein
VVCEQPRSHRSRAEEAAGPKQQQAASTPTGAIHEQQLLSLRYPRPRLSARTVP